jgi:excisionase family DNA binding protein
MSPTIVVSGETMRAFMDFTDNREAFAVREFCARYGICRQTFYDEIRRGRIKAVKLGKKTMILRADAETWAKSLPTLDLAATA